MLNWKINDPSEAFGALPVVFPVRGLQRRNGANIICHNMPQPRDISSQASPTRREGYITKYRPLYTSGTQSVLRVIEMRGGLGG